MSKPAESTQAGNRSDAIKPMRSDLAYIVVEGPIGIGKTQLAAKLARSLSYDLILEPVENNPFLEKFYSEPEKYALATQLYFLMHRIEKVRHFEQGKIFYPGNVCDFLVEKDRLFAQLTLDQAQFELYERVYRSCAQSLPKPDLVIYLQAPVDILIERIIQRGRYFERGIERPYLVQVSEMYSEFFYHYHQAPLLIVNAAKADFRKDSYDYQQLLEKIQTMDSQRIYFNSS